MGEPSLYSVYACWADGILLSEAMEIDTTIESDDVVVKVMLQDFPGITPGPSVRRVRIKNTIPFAGPSVDFERKKIRKEPTRIRIQRLSDLKVCETTCFVVGNVSTTSGVGKNSEQDVELCGAASEFQ
jgi:hypothetical protein